MTVWHQIQDIQCLHRFVDGFRKSAHDDANIVMTRYFRELFNNQSDVIVDILGCREIEITS